MKGLYLFLILIFSLNCLSFSEEDESLVEEKFIEDSPAGQLFPETAEDVAEPLPLVQAAPENPSIDFRNSSELLSFSQFEDEVIEIAKDSDKRVIIYSIGNKTNRRFFDEDYRLKKSEFWEIASYDNSKIIKSELFYYKGDSKRPYLKTVDYENKREDFYYRDDGIVLKKENYKKIGSKNYITEITRWSFDSQNRITQVKTRTFLYNDEDDTKRRDVFVKTFSYKYNPPSEDGREIPPDVKYYENDVLKSHERYSSKPGTYSQHFYFDGGINIKTWYVDNQKVREVIYKNNDVIRVNKIDENKVPSKD